MTGGGVRQPAVSGRFYAGRRDDLRRSVEGMLATASSRGAVTARSPKVIIAPHAAYVYSGPVAATAYAALGGLRSVVRRVVVAGPAHYAAVDGVAAPGCAAFATPLGEVAVDVDARRRALRVAGVAIDDHAHAPEHSLEVQLPLLMCALGEVSVLPLLVGRHGAGVLADVLDDLWGGEETRVVISTDLSHYLGAPAARVRDHRTAEAICRLDAPDPEAACGATAVAGAVSVARRRALEVQLLDLRSSADTYGDADRVVGYGAFAMFEPDVGDPIATAHGSERQQLDRIDDAASGSDD